MDSVVRVLFLGNSASAVRAVGQLEGAMGGVAKAGKILGTVLTTAVVGGLAESVKAAVSFDKAMRGVQVAGNLTERQLKSLSTQTLALAKVTAQSPDSLAAGLQILIGEGFKARDALKILEVSGKAATATFSDTKTVVNAVANVLKQYGASASEARKFTDPMVASVVRGKVSWDSLTTSLSQVLPVAVALHMPFANIIGIFEELSRQGIETTRSAMGLRMVLSALLKPNADLKAALIETGDTLGNTKLQAELLAGKLSGTGLTKALKDAGNVSVEAALNTKGLLGVLTDLFKLPGGADIIARWFPARSSAIIFDIKKHLGEFTQSVRESQNATDGAGATNRAYAEAIKSISVQWQLAKASLVAAAVPIGQLLLPALSKAAGYASTFAAEITKLMGELHKLNTPLAASTQELHRHGESTATAGVHVSRFARDLHDTIVVAGHVGGALAGLAKGGFVLLVDAIRTGINWAEQMHAADTRLGNALRDTAHDIGGYWTAGMAAFVAAIQTGIRWIQDMIHLLGAIPRTVNIGFHVATGGVVGAAKGVAGFVTHPFGLGRAEGGFIPGATGAATPILAHAGEIVLNPSQQQMLGGPRYLSQIFGFTGEAGPGSAMAAGGIVGKAPPHSHVAHPPPHHTLKPRGYTKLSSIATAALAAVDAVNALESQGDRFFGQEERRLQIEHGFDLGDSGLYKMISVPLTYDHTGFDTAGNPVAKGSTVFNDFGEAVMQDIEVIDDDAFKQRLADIDELVGMRQAMIGLLDDEKNKLETAISDLNKAIVALQAEIAKEVAAAKAEKDRVIELEATIKAKREQVQDERAKKKTVPGKGKKATPHQVSAADPKLIARLNDDISNLSNQLGPHRTAAAAHTARAGTLQSQLKTLSDDRDTAKLNLDITLPGDRRDVSLDVEEFLGARGKLVALPSETGRGYGTPGATGPTVGGGGGGVSSVTSADTGLGVDQSALIADLAAQLAAETALLGQARLALGVEAAQLPQIQAFQFGTLNVPQTGPALVHAGEQIIPAGRRGGDSGSSSDSSYHEVHLDLGEPLNALVKSQVIQLTPEISLAMGRESNRKRRAGAF